MLVPRNGSSRLPANERRRNDIERVNDMTVKVTRYQGRVLLLGAGEASFPLHFPVYFSERPIVYFGLEFDENSHPAAGNYPLWGAAVSKFYPVGAVEGAFEGYYAGATVVVRVVAPDDTKFWLHYTFDGKALRNPLAATQTTDESI